MVVSVPGRTETAQPLPAAPHRPSRAGGCWNTPEFYPTTTFCCWLGKIQVCFSIILCPKSSGSFPKCWSPPESSDGCANPILAASPGIPGDLRCPERAVGSSPWLLGVSWCRLMIDSAILPRCFGRCLPPSLAAPAGNKH